MNIKTTPEHHLEMMRTLENVLKHFAQDDNMLMYDNTIAIREYLQHLADQYAMMRITIDRMVVNQLAALDNK